MGVVMLTTLIAYFNFNQCCQWSMTNFGNNPPYKFGTAELNLPWQQFDNIDSYL